jgi:chromosome segregation ATPase
VTPPVNDPVTSIDPAYEAVLRKMVGDLEHATDAHERWAAANALQGQADSAIGELLDTVTVLRAERDAAIARADAAEAEVKRWREPQGEIDMLISDIEAVIAEAERVDQLGNGPIREAREALATLRARDIGASAALHAAQLRYHEAEAAIAALRRAGEAS